MNEKKEITVFNKTDIYDEEIAPVIAQLRKICSTNNIPFFFSCCVKNDENGSEYRNDGISTGSRSLILKDDRFEQHLCVEAGFKTSPGNTEIEINFDELGDMDF